MAMTEAIASVKVDDERVKVTEYRFPPGSHTGWHRHGMAYVVVPTRSGRLRLVSKEGERTADLVAGEPYSRPAGVEHDVINDGPGEVAFIEVEIKTLAG